MTGLGTQIIDALTADLEGAIERTYTESGAIITLRFPESQAPAEHHLSSQLGMPSILRRDF
jgi:two-component sensor histidine kinase